MATTKDSNEQTKIRLNEDGVRIPTRADGLDGILRYLMPYCVCPSDQDYNKQAIYSLLRKLQDNRKHLQELIETITWRGTRPSKCFTIPRTMDGRCQVAARKGLPHVVYAQIWRWKDLGKSPIIHIPSCTFGYDLNHEKICVNPYHYKKINIVGEIFSKSNSDSNQNKNILKSHMKSNEAAHSQNDADNDGGKKEGMSQRLQSQDTYQLNRESIIPIVVEHQINATEYIEPQQKKNDVKLLQGRGHHQSNTPLQLQGGIQENENNFIEDNRNVETPAVSLSMCEQVLLNQSDFQNFSLCNNQRQDNFEKTINLPAPSNTLLVKNNPPLLSNCNQPSQNLVRGDVRSVPMNALPPPVPMNQLPPPVAMDGMPPSVLTNEMPPPRKIPVSSNSMFINSNRQINLPPPSSTPLPNNPPMFSHSLFEDEDFQSTEKQHNELPTNYSQKLENKNMSLNCTLERILAEDDSQQTANNNPLENTLNETLDQILSQVQNTDKKPSSTEQKLENELFNNNTKPITTQSNIEQELNSNQDDNVPMEVSNYKEMIEQNNNKQLQPISNVSQLTQNMNAMSPISVISPLSSASASTRSSPISSIMPLSPISTVRSQSPISNTQPLSPEQYDSNLLLLDIDNKNTTGKSTKSSTNQKQHQKDKTAFLDEDIHETMTRNNNTQRNNSLHFSDTMISFINNNIMEQKPMSSVSKCEQYLRNQSGETNSLENNKATILETIQNSCMQNNAQQDHNPVQSHDTELQRSNFNEFFNMPNVNCRTKNLIPIDDSPLEHWCSIDYFELDTQVSDTFKVKNEHTTVIVDGYLDPDGGNRFSLGRLTNIRRTQQSERTRMHIAQGIALELRNDGDIWLQCRSKNSVFIKAHFLDMQSDRSCRNSVHKILSGECKKVFDLQRCYKHIKAQIATAQAALKVQQMTMGPSNRPINNLSGLKGLEAIGMNVDDLRRVCILQISFVKGWGPDYSRQTIKETPCWIEVHVHKALQILDNFLLLDKPIVRGMD